LLVRAENLNHLLRDIEGRRNFHESSGVKFRKALRPGEGQCSTLTRPRLTNSHNI